VSTYTLDYTSQLSGVPKDKLEALAQLVQERLRERKHQ